MHPFLSKDELVTYDFIRPDLQKKKDTVFGTIYVDLDRGDISFIQRWSYKFTAGQVWSNKDKKMLKANNWADEEQLYFHYAATSLIWKFFNAEDLLPTFPLRDPTVINIVKLLNSTHPTLCYTVMGKGDFAKKHQGKKLFVNFDVAISVTRPHFRTTVRKMPVGFDHAIRPHVDYNSRTIDLARADVLQTGVMQDGKDAAKSYDFYYLPHEFGHAIGYGIDEYEVNQAKRKDVNSLMNIGKEIRGRHFAFITHQLNTMFAGTTFLMTDANPNG